MRLDVADNIEVAHLKTLTKEAIMNFYRVRTSPFVSFVARLLSDSLKPQLEMTKILFLCI